MAMLIPGIELQIKCRDRLPSAVEVARGQRFRPNIHKRLEMDSSVQGYAGSYRHFDQIQFNDERLSLDVLNGSRGTEFVGMRERAAKNCNIIFAVASRRV
jgi:hypothetical protein